MIIWSGILCLRYCCDRNKLIPSRFACVPLISPLNCVSIRSYIHTYLCCGAAAKLGPRAPHSWDIAITMRHAFNWMHTPGRTPLDEWSVRWKAAACTTHSTTPETNIHAFSGIRTHDSSNRAAADVCLRALAHTPAKPEPGLAELRFRQISVPNWNSTSRAPGRRPAHQFQCNCIGTCTRVWTCRCRTTGLNTPVCMKPTRC